MPIQKIDLPPRIEFKTKEDGTVEEKHIPQWEIKATGREVQELRGVFKESGLEMAHDSWKEWNAIGETTISKPDGSTDVVRADKEHLYRNQPGFCIHATKPTFTMHGFGGMKKEGITRMRIRYSNGTRTIEEIH